jgi:hypothetical protein
MAGQTKGKTAQGKKPADKMAMPQIQPGASSAKIEVNY